MEKRDFSPSFSKVFNVRFGKKIPKKVYSDFKAENRSSGLRKIGIFQKSLKEKIKYFRQVNYSHFIKKGERKSKEILLLKEGLLVEKNKQDYLDFFEQKSFLNREGGFSLLCFSCFFHAKLTVRVISVNSHSRDFPLESF